jgi:hypothetical protein
MSPDGRSFITAAALRSTTLWVHDERGDRQAVLEGDVAEPRFTRDGKKLLYRIVKEGPTELSYFRDAGEVRILDLASGRSEAVVSGFNALDYDVSTDGRQVVMQIAGRNGKPELWLAALDHSSSPRQIPGVEGNAPRFLPNGDIVFRHVEGRTISAGSTGFIYRTHQDGSAVQKVINQPVLIVEEASPDGKWLSTWSPLGGDGPPTTLVFPLDGGAPINIGAEVYLVWSLDNGSIAILPDLPGLVLPDGRSYIIPISGGTLPALPAEGVRSEQEIAAIPGARRFDLAPAFSDITGGLTLGPTPNVYAFYRGHSQRNLYRVPIP